MRAITLACAVALASSACGPDLEGEQLDELLVAPAPHLPLQTCLAPPIADGDVIDGGRYRVNDQGDHCVLVSKYNGDVDAGCDMSQANYDAFLACVGGCQQADGFDASPACLRRLMECQRHLCGEPFKLVANNNTNTAASWRSFLK